MTTCLCAIFLCGAFYVLFFVENRLSKKFKLELFPAEELFKKVDIELENSTFIVKEGSSKCFEISVQNFKL